MWHAAGWILGDMRAVEANAGSSASRRRSTGSPRGEARRRELLARVTEDLAVNGLVDFSLRRAARAAGTTHKVLLYYFDDAEDLLEQAMLELRERRIRAALEAALEAPGSGTLGARVRAIWPVLMTPEAGLRVIDQAIGLAMYDPERYAHLGREASAPYLPALRALCPPEWPEERTDEVTQMMLAAFRGFLLEWRTTGRTDAVEAGLDALARALDREAAAP
jgi:AcrR family transcriptional regulator